LVEQKFDKDIGFACLRLPGRCGLFLVDRFGSGDGYVCREMVFEECLPDNVGRVTDDAEYGELDYGRNVESKGCLSSECVSSEWAVTSLQGSYAIFVGRYCLRKHIRRHA
jgi:hypothetical protein